MACQILLHCYHNYDNDLTSQFGCASGAEKKDASTIAGAAAGPEAYVVLRSRDATYMPQRSALAFTL